jgi:hypothetical protein
MSGYNDMGLNQGGVGIPGASGTTSINDLPYAPSQPANITMQVNDKNNSVLSLDPNTISQIVSGIQEASKSGATLLPSRDIPQNTLDIHQDPNVQVDYIPDNRNKDEITANEKQMDDYYKNIEYENKNQKNTSDRIDQFYNDLHTPLLLVILYFLFQLPIIRKKLFQYIPFLFLKDGNPNIYYLLFTSFMFGSTFYLLDGILERLKTI